MSDDIFEKKINISLSFWEKNTSSIHASFVFWPNKNPKPIYILQ